MFISSTALARVMQAGLDFAEVSTKTVEMAVAANTVIGERVALMAEAVRDPLAADYVEFARILPEKATAIHQAGAALLDGWWTLQRDIGDYMIYVARAVTSGRPTEPRAIAELAERTSVHGTRIGTTAIDAAGVVLAPFHQIATSNARRLSHRKQRG
jgi:hypothetical protein